jgi:hypothetical protein
MDHSILSSIRAQAKQCGKGSLFQLHAAPEAIAHELELAETAAAELARYVEGLQRLAATRSRQVEAGEWPGARRWEVGSREPDVPQGFKVRSAVNGVVFHRTPWGRWHAEPPLGDGRDYEWFQLNGVNAAEGGMELVEFNASVEA